MALGLRFTMDRAEEDMVTADSVHGTKLSRHALKPVRGKNANISGACKQCVPHGRPALAVRTTWEGNIMSGNNSPIFGAVIAIGSGILMLVMLIIVLFK
jgi:hypothetical protein